jgi:hypothetical protein
MEDKEKLKLYKETLEKIAISGHTLRSIEQTGDTLSYVIECAIKSLEEDGDIVV